MEGLSMNCLRFIVLTCVSLLLGCSHTGTPFNPEADIRKVLNDQVNCWNNGNLEGFMQGYWNSEELEFKSGGKITQGWQATFDRYKKRYQADGAEMGTLKFSNLVVTSDSPKATVSGDWHLTMKDGKTPHGSFVLSLELKPDGWKIVRDETSAAE
jgi:hypothetical protein